MVNGKKVVTDTSISVHAVTGGGKYGNAKAVSVTQIGNKRNVSKITLKMGKTAQIKANEVKKDKKIARHRKRDWSNREIAEHMGVSLNTVKHYLTDIFNKLHVKKRDELKNFVLK